MTHLFMNKFYITTPIYYVNAKPHIGHAYSTIVADVLARFWREKGYQVHFLTGTDEHGQKIQKAADEKGISPKEFTDQISPKFRDLWAALNVKNDDFIRTTEPRHMTTVQKVLQTLKDSGHIYEGSYGGWYCVPCETFYTESEVQGDPSLTLASAPSASARGGTTPQGGRKCPQCRRAVEHIEEKNYFFKLTQYQDWLTKYIHDNPDFIFPETRRNEVLGFLNNNKLQDLCISRPKERLSWGIPLPFDPNHVAYVWFDALVNYISAIGYGVDETKFKSLWPADVHIMAKDIIRHHAVYWPIMLKALNLPQPKHIVAHGWWKMDDAKMSKSLGNVVDPVEMIRKYGVDAFRYFLMRDVNFGSDGNFSIDNFETRFNNDLANDMGNLVFRTLSMSEKYIDGVIPKIDKIKFPAEIDSPLLKDFVEDKLAYSTEDDFRAFNFTGHLEHIWSIVGAANKFVEQVKPWELKKAGKTEELRHFLAVMFKVIRYTAVQISPYMPDTSTKILAQIQGDKVSKGEPLFPRLEAKAA
ncbi:MAG: methionine--tRNA ligase [Candidatus Omnitrophica bacterium CG12_big_fil_rev_8_21_14_0_65_50_5]|nr:MAG: methionine--tRNA ligase [Candidatus Omnitrophica bacterium CG12_big_fil_rev_8_21_14_0_65_50_5]